MESWKNDKFYLKLPFKHCEWAKDREVMRFYVWNVDPSHGEINGFFPRLVLGQEGWNNITAGLLLKVGILLDKYDSITPLMKPLQQIAAT